MPVDLGFEVLNCGVYVAPTPDTVCWALELLGWDPQEDPRPLLVVPLRDYTLAAEIADAYRGALAITGTLMLKGSQWFVAWRGRAVGSRSGGVGPLYTYTVESATSNHPHGAIRQE